MTRVTRYSARDVRAPTSRTLAGSDAVHDDPDYSAAYVVLATDHVDGHAGHGLTFTIGRGTEVVCAAIDALAPHVVGRDLDEITGDFAAFHRSLTNDSQLRWLGPEKGVVHLATAAIVNAVWDLWAKVEGKPVWKLVSDLTPERFVSLIDFRYLTDAITPDEALEMLRDAAPGRAAREAAMRAGGYPAYITSAGWLGYPEEKVRRLCGEAIDAGWTSFKTKVGIDVAGDVWRCEVMREEIGWERDLMADANQVWDVPEAIAWMRHLEPYRLRWIEEPTSPDDVLGHAAIRSAVAPVGVATGEHAANKVVFKQMLAAGAIDYCQVDACRLGGLNEVLAVLLHGGEARRAGLPPRRGSRALRVRAAHLARRPRRARLPARRSDHRVRRPSPRALPRPRPRQRRALPGARGTRLLDRDAPGVARRSRVPRRLGVVGRGGGVVPEPAERLALGRTALTVTRLGLGGAPLGGMFRSATDDDARATVDAAWGAGVRTFDTAPLYGHGLSERRFGAALRERSRNDYVLATKVGRLLVPGREEESIFADAPPLRPVFDFSHDGVLRSLAESLDRLGLDRVDIVHVHDPDDHGSEALDGAFPALRRLRDEGAIGAVGAGMNQTALLTRFVREAGIDCVLLAGRYTLLEQGALDDLLPACAERGVAVIAGGVFNSGLLADPRAGATYDYAPAPDALVARAARIGEVCAAHGVPLRAAALQLPAAHPVVATVLTGARTAGEIAENAAHFSHPIPPALWDDLRSAGLLRDEAPTP